MKAPPPPPEKRPDWMSITQWHHLQQDYQTASSRYKHAKRKEADFEESKRLSELATRHYEDSLEILTQHTIEDA